MNKFKNAMEFRNHIKDVIYKRTKWNCEGKMFNKGCHQIFGHREQMIELTEYAKAISIESEDVNKRNGLNKKLKKLGNEVHNKVHQRKVG